METDFRQNKSLAIAINKMKFPFYGVYELCVSVC